MLFHAVHASIHGEFQILTREEYLIHMRMFSPIKTLIHIQTHYSFTYLFIMLLFVTFRNYYRVKRLTFHTKRLDPRVDDKIALVSCEFVGAQISKDRKPLDAFFYKGHFASLVSTSFLFLVKIVL